MRAARLALVAAVLASLLACRTIGHRAEQPATIVHPTARSRAALTEAVSAALHGAPVVLAPDALTGETDLLVDPFVRRDASGLPLQGRERGRPERFALVKSGPECILVHEPDGRRFTLSDTECAPSSGVAPRAH